MALCGSCGPVDREKRSLDLLRLVGLDNMANKLPAAVSGGQQQSVAIARALANDPPILIADEPTGNLDSRSADEVFEIFNGLVEQGKTILMVTHDPTLAQRTHRTLLLSDGELINPWVAQAFAELSHSQMLWLTHHMQPKTISPGAPAIPTGTLPPGVCLVTGGQMEVAIKHKPRGESTLKLQPGEYFTAYQPSANGNGAHTLRASLDKPAELLTLELATLREWLKANPEAEAVLQAGSSRFESFEGVAQ
jgi:ABC-type sulfate/molybdate transport systems ATPase subunit